jgi:anti-sigma factor RsiW
MSENEQLKLQAYLDGELAEKDRAEVAQWLDTSEEARALLAELQHARAAVRGNEQARRLDRTRELYWSGIERGIEAYAARTVRSEGLGALGWLRHHLAQIAGAATGIALVALTLTVVSEQPEPDSTWEVLDPNTGMVNYSDFKNGITVVMLYDQSTPGFTPGN